MLTVVTRLQRFCENRELMCDMAEYQAIYKCRLCGELVKGDIFECEEILGFNKTQNAILDKNFNIMRVTIYEEHRCEDASLGIVDFMGFRRCD